MFIITFNTSGSHTYMTERTHQELFEVIQSSNINFLLGSGVSTPFLPLLGNIEKDLNKASSESEKIIHYKKYLKEVMLPNKQIITSNILEKEKYQETRKGYLSFFNSLAELILKRKSTILSKQVNLFTTNIDVLMELFLEEMQIEYNDGFSGKFLPTFSIANFKRSYFQRSLHYDHFSEIPVFNIVKIHGSTTWKYNDNKEKITFSKTLDCIKDETLGKEGSSFIEDYKEILVVNPEEAKHLESVINVFYSELLRMYSSELEKENTSLFVLGFSMEDQHIREITLRAAKSNPTLRVFMCCAKDEADAMTKKLETALHPNIQLFIPTGDGDYFTISHFADIISGKLQKTPSTDEENGQQ